MKENGDRSKTTTNLGYLIIFENGDSSKSIIKIKKF